MKPFLRVLLAAFYALAWILVIAAAALIAIEESGVLTRVVERRLARELGPLGPFVEVERARLLWFEPGLLLDGVKFRGERDDTGRWIPGRERLRLSTIHVRLDPTFDPRRPVREVEVRGGRLALSEPLFEAMDELGRRREPTREPAQTPRVSFRGVALAVELPSGESLPIGSADAYLAESPEAAGDLNLTGRVSPSLGGAVQALAPILLAGRLTADGGFELRAAARSVEVDTAGLPAGDAKQLFGIERLSGELDLELSAGFRPGEAPPEAALKLRLEDGVVQLPNEEPVTALGVGIDLEFHPEPGVHALSPDAWSGRANAAAFYNRTGLTLTALVGREAPRDAYVEAWAGLDSLPLDLETLRAFHLNDVFQVTENFAALEPEGLVDVACGWRVPRPSLEPGAPFHHELVAVVEHDGRSGMTFRGWQDEQGIRRGVPLPCDDLRGRVAVAIAPALDQMTRVALVDLSAAHPTGRAFGEGLITSQPGGGKDSELDLALHAPSVAVDAALGDAIKALGGIERTWDALAPSGGTVSADWRLRRRRELGGTTGHGRVTLDNVGMMWNEVPVPLTGIVGELELRWAALSSVVTDGAINAYGKLPKHRPIGALYEMGTAPGATQSTGLSVRARGLVRESPLPREVLRAEIPKVALESLEVDLAGLLLRGRDWDVLAARFPEAGEQVAELRGQGRIDAHFRGRRPTARSPYRYDVEVSARPGEVVLTPSVFRRQTQDVTGRVLVHGRALEAATADRPEPEVESEGRFHVFGAWGGDVVLGAIGTLPAEGGGDVIVRGAGVDPTSPTFKGALASSLSAQGGGREVDLVDLRVEGRLDFEARVELPEDRTLANAEPESAYRIHLRNNRFTSENFELSGLAGVLIQEGESLSSPAMRATLGGTPVELSQVLMAPLDTAGEHPRADPRLAQEGFTGDGDGFAFQADWRAAGLVLDKEHLSPFLDEATLDVLAARGLGGSIDVAGARVIAISQTDGGGKVAFRGDVTPREVRLTAGLPLALLRGRIDVEDLVLEAGRVRGWWRLSGLDAEVAGRSLSDAAMTMTYVDGRLTVDNLRGSFAGGEITSLGAGEQADRAIAVDLTAPYAYTVALRLRRVAVQEILGGILAAGVEDLGEASSTLRLRGRGTEVLALAGNGSMRLDNARLWSIPVVRALFRALGADATAVFDRMDLAWELSSGTLNLQSLRVQSPILSLVGEGAVELTGELRTDLQVRYSLVDRLGPLNRVVYWLNNNLWRVAIRGDVQSPLVLVRNSLIELALGFDEDVPRSLPLPGLGPLGRRF